MAYPDLQSFESMEIPTIDKLVIEYLKTTPTNVIYPEGFAVAIAGANLISSKKNVRGIITDTERINFVFLIKRYTQINEQRRDISDFILNLRDWINAENKKRGKADEHSNIPHFSMTDYEQIIADGGMPIGVEEDGTDIFSLQIHIDYQTVH